MVLLLEDTALERKGSVEAVSSFWSTTNLQLNQDAASFPCPYLLQSPPLGVSCLCEVFLGDGMGLCLSASVFILCFTGMVDTQIAPCVVTLHCWNKCLRQSAYKRSSFSSQLWRLLSMMDSWCLRWGSKHILRSAQGTKL